MTDALFQSHTDPISTLPVAKRVSLAQKAGTFMHPMSRNIAKRETAVRIAHALVSDCSQEVREALAFELRSCRDLPREIATKIACDIDDIAVPFLRVTPGLSDKLAAELIPLMSDNAHLALAVRADIGRLTSHQLACHGNGNAALILIGNPSVIIGDALAELLIEHHEDQARVMDAIAKRADIPLSVAAAIVGKVSDHMRIELVERYDIDENAAAGLAMNPAHEATWMQIRKAGPAQIHAHVIDLRSNSQLQPDLVLAMAEQGCLAFMESALALQSGRTLMDIRETLHLANPSQFVDLMRAANISETLAPKFLRLAKRHYRQSSQRRSVGQPTMWQGTAAQMFEPKPTPTAGGPAIH